MSPKNESIPSIINPEVPDTIEGKRLLLGQCMAIIAAGGIVEGVLPLHVTQDGAVLLGRAVRATEISRSAL